MSLAHTPPPPQTQELAQAAPIVTVTKCLICNDDMTDTQDILVIATCNHEFHRICIETSLSQSAECPCCRKSCDLADLTIKRFETHLPRNSPRPKQVAQTRAKARGAMAKKYNTRGASKNLNQEFAQTPIANSGPSNLHLNTGNYEVNSPFRNNQYVPQSQTPIQQNFQTLPNRPTIQPSVDLSQLNQMIENSITRLLGNLNIIPNNNQTFSQNNFQPIPQQHYQNFYGNNLRPNSATNQPTREEPFAMRAEKVTSIIQNWNLKFDGSTNGLNVEEFLYRLEKHSTGTGGTINRKNFPQKQPQQYYPRRNIAELEVPEEYSTETTNSVEPTVDAIRTVPVTTNYTGANVSCIGSDLANYDFSKFSDFSPIKTIVRTADGTVQRTLGTLDVDIRFKDQVNKLKILIVPSLSQRLILGLDFWKSFKLAADMFESAIVSDTSENSSVLSEIIKMSDLSENKSDLSENNQKSQIIDNYQYPLTPSQQQQLTAIINLFPNFEKNGLGKTSLIKHEIDVGCAKPIKQKFYPVSPAVERLIFKEIDRMLALGVIEESSSPWSSPMRLVLKPNKVRLCLDARKVNFLTKKDAYPLPNIDGIFSRLPKANLISKLDLKDAYWQIGLADEAKPITAFTVPGRPLYQFRVMPFGLCTAPQTMCRLMDQIIPPDLKYCVFGYLDDLIIVSEDFSSHLSTLVRIAEQFRKANLTLNVTKSSFCVTQVKYLGYVIGCGGIKTDPEKIESILKWPVPKNIKQVRGFLGLAGWYRRFIENFSTVVFPITEVLSTKRKYQWTESAQTAFDTIKTMLTTAPVLSNPDFSQKFYLHCDASDYGIGAVLVQLDKEGCEKPIAYMSKKLNTAQRNYSVTERECLAAVEAIQKFRCYLELQEFEVITDHSSLVWLMKQPNLSGRLARWVFKLQSYKFSISHRKGKDHIVPDALSRMYTDEVASIELAEEEIDLDSPHFEDKDYQDLKTKILQNEAQYPDIKIVEKYDLRTRPIAFSVGQEVYRRNFSQSNFEKRYNAKLAPVFLKAKIREKVGNHYYVLEDTNGKVVGTFHAKDIRP
ncbi:uncharacterized protein LOC135958385 [Calliphora vicina]|uniref:uncharacterized protein LOC135958385 n=1 Tax=Calliphora vicina TaxID=7373 RepID=UPI00325A55CA